MASRQSQSVAAGAMGCGSNVTPSKPDSPILHQPLSELYATTTEAGTVYVDSVHSIAYDWFLGARIYFDVALSYRLEHASGIEGSLFERSIPMYGAYTEQVYAGIMGGKEESVCILSK